tara:strand:- start:1838 stop:2203 length:366 start_codon:yes stop_codon:yes gene_type:complete
MKFPIGNSPLSKNLKLFTSKAIIKADRHPIKYPDIAPLITVCTKSIHNVGTLLISRTKTLEGAGKITGLTLKLIIVASHKRISVDPNNNGDAILMVLLGGNRLNFVLNHQASPQKIKDIKK